MKVPAEIRAVPRPTNTVVTGDPAHPGPYQFAVHTRKKAVYRPGQTPSPRNGEVIGHIYEGKFVPLKKVDFASQPTVLSYGSAALLQTVLPDLRDDLAAAFPLRQACTILAIAALRIIKPGIPNCRLASAYGRNFLSRFYPGLFLTSNTVGRFCDELGKNLRGQREFFSKRLQRVLGTEHIAIDGTLKQNTSRVNNLSAYSRKARVKGCKDLSVLYAFDIEKREPLCAQVFPGNCLDATVYRDFIRDNGLTRGIILADKGFPSNKIARELETHPELHFMTPLKRNSRRIDELGLTRYDAVLTGDRGAILCAKRQDQNGRFLYGFKDERRAEIERRSYLERRQIKHDFTPEELNKRQERFGTIVIESDQDLPPMTVYRCYADRWLLELVFRRYKDTEALDRTRVQGDNSVYGSEFINLVATIMTVRAVRKAEDSGLLLRMTFGELMEDLTELRRRADAPQDVRYDPDNGWAQPLQHSMDAMVSLGLIPPPPGSAPTPRKRGRPRKQALPDTVPSPMPTRKRGRPRTKPETDAPKRPRGRPRKNPVQP